VCARSLPAPVPAGVPVPVPALAHLLDDLVVVKAVALAVDDREPAVGHLRDGRVALLEVGAVEESLEDLRAGRTDGRTDGGTEGRRGGS
jgi:hypothetical protein